MYLSLITGNDPIESMVILYGFIQQSMLFDLISNPDAVGPLGFFNELATVFSMIGLLVLVFSPSLWKAKYVVCWFALFIIVYLGASTGPEFGYNFIKLKGFGQLNLPIHAEQKPPCLTNDDCFVKTDTPDMFGIDKIHTDAIQQTTGFTATFARGLKNVLPSGAQKAADTTNTKPEYIVVDNNGYLQELNFSGFMPQVIILYVTNKLRYSLISAMNALVKSDDLQKKVQTANIMANARIANDQTDFILHSFDNKCSSSLPDGMNTKQLLTATGKIGGDLESPLTNNKVTVADVILMSDMVDKSKNALQIEPLFVIPETKTLKDQTTISNPDLVEFMTTSNSDIKNIMNAFSANRTADGDAHLDKTELEALDNGNTAVLGNISNSEYTYDGDDDFSIMGAFYNPMYEYKYNESEGTQHSSRYNKLMKKIQETLQNPGSNPELEKLLNTQVTMYLPAHNISNIVVKGTKKKQQQEIDNAKVNCQGSTGTILQTCLANAVGTNTKTALETSQDLQSNFETKAQYVPITDCSDLYNLTNTVITADKEDQIKTIGDNIREYTGEAVSGTTDDSKTRYVANLGVSGEKQKMEDSEAIERITSGNIPSELAAIKAMYIQLEEKAALCYQENGGDAETCTDQRKDIADFDRLLTSSMIDNAFGNKYETNSNLKTAYGEGAAGLASYLGGAFTKYAAAPVTWLGTIGNAFKQGAYEKVLPIIKNIAIAFILVLTPILLLMGLLVPQWAPGVILTVLISLFYIKCVDITIVLVQGMLTLVESIFKQVFANSNSDFETLLKDSTYINMMGIIWSMAYMASFAITAFLMFAAGNTKAVIGKLTGMDSTVKSTSEDIYRNGAKLASMAAAAPATIASGAATAATMAGKVAAFNQLAADEGLGAAIAGTMGTLKGEYNAGMLAQEDKMTATLAREAGDRTRIGKGDEGRIARHKETIDKAEDKYHIEHDDFLSDQEDRIDKKTRLNEKTDNELGRARGDAIKRSKKYSKYNKIDENDNFNGINIRMQHPYDPERTVSLNTIGARKQLENGSTFDSALNTLGGLEGLSEPAAKERIAEARLMAAAVENTVGYNLNNNSTTRLTKNGKVHDFGASAEDMIDRLQRSVDKARGVDRSNGQKSSVDPALARKMLDNYLGEAKGIGKDKKYSMKDKIDLSKISSSPGNRNKIGSDEHMKDVRKKMKNLGL